MKFTRLIVTIIGMVLIVVFIQSVANPIGASPALQATATPSFFNYLPLVGRNSSRDAFSETPTITSTPTATIEATITSTPTMRQPTNTPTLAPTQPPAEPLDLRDAESTDVVLFGHEARDHFGTDLASGDINGDGVADLAIGAYLADGPGNTRNGSGEVHVY